MVCGIWWSRKRKEYGTSFRSQCTLKFCASLQWRKRRISLFKTHGAAADWTKKLVEKSPEEGGKIFGSAFIRYPRLSGSRDMIRTHIWICDDKKNWQILQLEKIPTFLIKNFFGFLLQASWKDIQFFKTWISSFFLFVGQLASQDLFRNWTRIANLLTFTEPRNRFQGFASARLHRLWIDSWAL
jgi:hypothetical protein